MLVCFLGPGIAGGVDHTGPLVAEINHGVSGSDFLGLFVLSFGPWLLLAKHRAASGVLLFFFAPYLGEDVLFLKDPLVLDD